MRDFFKSFLKEVTMIFNLLEVLIRFILANPLHETDPYQLIPETDPQHCYVDTYHRTTYFFPTNYIKYNIAGERVLPPPGVGSQQGRGRGLGGRRHR